MPRGFGYGRGMGWRRGYDRGFGTGRGWGRGFGQGRGWCWGPPQWTYPPQTAYGPYHETTNEYVRQEMEVLKAEKAALDNEISELEKILSKSG